MRTTPQTILRMLFILVVFLSGQYPISAQVFNDSLSTSILKMRSLEELMEMDITIVSKRPESWLTAPAAVYVITNDDIRRSGASTIPEALRLASNLQVARKGSAGWGISARGFNTELANKLLILIDGRTVYTPLYSGVFWDRQDYLLKDVDRIEVVSGPGGTLWGANAMNGVINIITKNSDESQGLYLEGLAGGGTKLQDFVGGRYGGTLASNMYYRIYAKYFNRDGEIYSVGKDTSDSWKKGQGGIRIDAEISPQDKIILQGDAYTTDQNMVAGGISTTSGGNILSRWTHTFLDGSDMNLQVYYDRTELYLPTAPFFSAPAGNFQDYLDTYDLDFQHRFNLDENNSIVWGFGYRFTHDVVKNSPALGFFPTVLDQNLYSGFIQDQVTLMKDLFFSIGTKIEHNDYTGLEFEPGTRLQWNFIERQMIWAAVSRAVRIPSRIDRDQSLPTPPNSIFPFPPPFPQVLLLVGGPNFKSETVIAYELGYRTQIGDDIITSISTFYNVYDNIRSTDTSAGTFLNLPLYFANDLEAETYGFEFNITYQIFHTWRVKGSYNLLKEHISVKHGKFDFNNKMNETADPEHQVSIHSSMDLFQSLEFDAGFRWIDVLHNNNADVPGNVPPYFELDIRIGWHPTEKFELSVVGQNLLHDHHPEFGFPRPTRGEIERSIYGKMSLTL